MSQDMTGRLELPMLAALAPVEADLDGLADGNCWSMSDADVGEFLDRIAAVEARIAGAKLAVIADADARNIGVTEATSTAGWLRSRLLMHPGDASRDATTATRYANSATTSPGATRQIEQSGAGSRLPLPRWPNACTSSSRPNGGHTVAVG